MYKITYIKKTVLFLNFSVTSLLRNSVYSILFDLFLLGEKKRKLKKREKHVLACTYSQFFNVQLLPWCSEANVFKTKGFRVRHCVVYLEHLVSWYLQNWQIVQRNTYFVYFVNHNTLYLLRKDSLNVPSFHDFILKLWLIQCKNLHNNANPGKEQHFRWD